MRDGQTVLGFQSRPELDRTLGSTSFQTNNTTGALISADIFLNTTFQWSIASGGQASRFDVVSIMTHEIGHLLGLGHSALGETQSFRRRAVGDRQARGHVSDRVRTRND